MTGLVIGYGSPLRGDDGIGWTVAERFQQIGPELMPRAVRSIACHQLLPEHCDSISESDLVIFVDATTVGEAGEIRVTPVSAETDAPASSHHLSPAALLAHTSLLYGSCPPAFLITVTGENFGFKEALSPVVEAAIPAVQTAVFHLLAAEKMRGDQQ